MSDALEIERLHQHMVRLHAVVEMGVIGEPPEEQARRILSDSRTALDFDYAELTQQCASGEYVRVCAVGEGAERLEDTLGTAGFGRERPHMVFDTLHDGLSHHHVVAALGLRSVLFWPFMAGEKRCMLAFGWLHPRAHFVSEDEIRYLDFLAALVSRLLDALEGQRRIAHRADTDLLTGIPNRAAVLDHLEREISAAQREDVHLALLYIDLNNFKQLNDQHGHAIGDAALQAIAQRIKSVLRKHELCGRFGGDEFCVIVPMVHSDEDLAIIARRLLDSLGEAITYDHVTLHPSASIGIATYPRDGTSAAELLAHADRAMYRAKRERTAAYAFYAEQTATTVDRAITFDRATFRSQFIMCYQPIVSARSGRPIAAEVLPRWLHPEGMRSPQAFLQAAQQQGVLRELDMMIARVALEKADELRNVADLAYHVNVSEPNEALIEAIGKSGSMLAIEVTEQQITAEASRYVAFAGACRSRGLRFGIADFASDHLSLSVLADLRPDFVKIRAGAKEAKRDSLSVLIDQAHHLSCTVIGESVETSSERQWLIANGVDALQGFEICSPLAEQDFSAWLRRYRT
ncbi:MAG TPA: diguanylate cyclase [Candidatus Baltobacteraceae bacterium]|nr:diguanylate cyclase [Candidatus Baltobacteraceae bacterium]